MHGSRLLPALLIALCLAGGAPRAAEPVFPDGSVIGLVPPPGLQPSTRFAGFENARAGASITINELPADAFATVADGMTAEALAARGLRDARREKVQVEGRDAVLVAAASAAGPVLILVAAGPAATAVVAARPGVGAPPDAVAAMRAALLGLVFRAPRELGEQVAALPFRLPVLAGFAPERTFGGSAVLLRPADASGDPRTQPLLTIAAAIGAPPAAEELEAFARRAIAGIPGFGPLDIRRAAPIRLGGAEWFEIQATATAADGNPPDPLTLRQAIRLTPSGYIRAVLVAPEAAGRLGTAFEAVLAALEPPP